MIISTTLGTFFIAGFAAAFITFCMIFEDGPLGIFAALRDKMPFQPFHCHRCLSFYTGQTTAILCALLMPWASGFYLIASIPLMGLAAAGMSLLVTEGLDCLGDAVEAIK